MDVMFLRRLWPAARQHWFVVALLLLFVGSSVPYTVEVFRNPNRSAIQRWREPLLRLGAGENIYRGADRGQNHSADGPETQDPATDSSHGPAQ